MAVRMAWDKGARCRWVAHAKTVSVGLIQATLLLSRFAAAVDVPTIYDYAAAIPLGGQAAGMAGAYTALGCREAALHFNPAALACATGSRLELSANSYILDSLSVPDPFGSNADFRSLTFTALPSAVGATRLLRKGDAHGAGALALGIAIELPRSVYIRADPADLKKAKFLSANVRDSLTTADFGMGYQISRYVALGASLGVGLRLFDHQYQAFQAGYGGADCQASAACSEMLQYSVRDEGFAVGARAKVGVRISPSQRWSLGAQLAFPTVNIAGRNALSIVQASGWSEGGDPSYDAVVFRDVGKSDLSLPFRVSAGVAWQGERVTVSGDLGLAFPRQVAFAYDVQQTTIDATGNYSEEQPDDVVLRPGWQPNGAIGIDVKLSNTLAVMGGVFSNVSSVSASDVDDKERTRLHMFGGTLGIGFLSRQADTYLGVSAQGGQASVPAYPLNLTGSNGVDAVGTSTQRRWTVAGFLSYSYRLFTDRELREGTPPAAANPKP